MARDVPEGAEPRTGIDRALRTTGALSVLLSQAVAVRAGMSPTDLEALDFLYLHGPMPAGRLAELTGLTTGAITGVVDRLERAGYARREADPTDRRRIIVRPLADKAEREIAPLYEPLSRAMDELLSRYTDEELAVILDFFTRAHAIGLEHIARLRAEAAETKKPKRAEAAGR